MPTTPYDLHQLLELKGYVIPMEGAVSMDTLSRPSDGAERNPKLGGTGERLKSIMESDRRNVYKTYFGEATQAESTWLAGDEPSRGMLLPMWAERLIHAEVLHMQEKIDTTIDYLLHHMSK